MTTAASVMLAKPVSAVQAEVGTPGRRQPVTAAPGGEAGALDQLVNDGVGDRGPLSAHGQVLHFIPHVLAAHAGDIGPAIAGDAPQRVTAVEVAAEELGQGVAVA